ncbi:MAG: hypothetical protein JF585_02935, partial [Burkholderiales bacterium]|nr:hypothetical protein [Burkholderiales bacterium]
TTYNFSQLVAAALRTTSGDDSVMGFGSSDTIDGGAGKDSIDGFDGDDVLRGGAGFDSIWGGAGNDTIEAGPDGGSLNGGAGDDTFIVHGGDGAVDIFDGSNAAAAGGFDTLVIDADPSAVEVYTWPSTYGAADDLAVVRWKDGSASVKFAIKSSGGAPTSVVESIHFRDGSVLDPNALTTKSLSTDASGKRTLLTTSSTVLPTDVQNLTASGNAPAVLIGNGQDNVIIGNAGANALNGLSFDAVRAVVDAGQAIDPPADMRAGIDTLIGGLGDDTYYTTSSNGESRDYIGRASDLASADDVVVELPGEGHDRVVTTAYYETLAANVEDLFSFNKQAYYDTYTGKDIEHVYSGNSLDNVIDVTRVFGTVRVVGGAGADTMIGSGEANNIYVVDDAGDVVQDLGLSSWGTVDTIESSVSYTLPDSIESLTLTGSDATLAFGNSDGNVLDGSGDSASNTLIGGLGDDTYRVDASDVVVENADEGSDTVVVVSAFGQTTFQMDPTSSIEYVMLAEAAGAVNVQGSSLDDSIQGNSANNTLSGGDGSDSIDDGSLLDPLWGNFFLSGTDTMFGGAGDDTITSSGGNDLVVGGVGNDSINFRMDRAQWKVGQLAFNRGDGHDTVTTSGNYASVGLVLSPSIDATELVLARADLDLIVQLKNSSDAITFVDAFADFSTNTLGSSGLSQIIFGDGLVLTRDQVSSRLTADNANVVTEGADALIGTSSHDVLVGNGGDDQLFAYGGDDDLTGGAGNDFVDGGLGNDTYFFAVGDGTDVIRDAGGVDKLKLASGLTEAAMSVAIEGEDLRLTFGSDSLLLAGAGRTGATSEIESVEFFDGTVRSAAYLRSIATIRGTAGSDSMIGTDAGDRIEGGAGNDTLQGLEGDDRLDGQEDDDRLIGGAGADTMIGGSGNDTFVVDSAADVVVELSGGGVDGVEASIDYTLGADVENLSLTGTTAINGTGNAAANTLRGNVGNNTLNGGGGNDTMVGGAGNDSYVVDAASDVVTEAAGEGVDSVSSSVTYTLSANVENLALTGAAAINGSGNTLDNVLTGNSGANKLTGSAGNDTLDGGIGTDTLVGGTGNDTYYVDATADVITENANEGTDAVTSSATYTLSANVENLTLTGATAINATGNASANVLTGNGAANRIDGGTGADTMIGGAGNDTYVVDNVGDVITELAAGGTDGVESSISYVLGAELENLTLTGTAAIDATGNAVANTLTGNAGVNRLDGGAGADTMVGGAGNDTYVVDSVGDVVTEAASGGTDTVETGITYTLGAEVENLLLTGTSNIDGTGNAAANTLRGNAGTNTLDGGAGNDTLIGGAGNDTYIVDSSSDVITENANEGTDSVNASATYTLSANVENLTLTGTTAINATGNASANVLIGNSAANRIDGSTGADTMSGGAGNDTYVVDSAGDVITELAAGGTDGVESSISWTLGAELENLTLTGSGTIDGFGNALNNSLTGNSGANRLDGGAGNDAMVGGAGNDTYVVDSASDVVTEAASGGTDTIESSITLTLGTEVENLTLTGTANLSATGNSVANTLRGNAGDNTLDGKAGSDTMIGGAGNDIYYVDATTDVVTEAIGEGIDTIIAAVTLPSLAANVENLTLTGTAGLGATGNGLDNVITGNSGANNLSGGAGNDTLDGGTGTDTLVGGVGNDTYVIDVATDVITELNGEGTDTVRSAVALTLSTYLENLTLTGTANNSGTGNASDNILIGNSGNNSLTALGGNDTLDGGAGADTLVGGVGNDTYYVDATTDVVTENTGEGTDTILTSVTLASLANNVENLTLTGTANINATGNTLDNVLTGNAGNNTLTGNAGADTLDGGAGNDTLNGGAGADTYWFGTGYGADLVVDNDATAGVKDVVRFGTGIAQSDIRFTQSGNALVATITSTSEALTIQDWYLGTQNRIEEFRFNDGSVLTNVQAQALVGAMAAFSPSGAGIATVQEQPHKRIVGIAVSAMI